MNEIIVNLLWIIQIIAALLIVLLVLLQHGKGADAGATFGSGGGSASLFGASGSSNFLSKSTAVLAAIFFLTTFGQVFMASGRFNGLGVMSNTSAKVNSLPTSNKALLPSDSKANSNKPNQIPN